MFLGGLGIVESTKKLPLRVASPQAGTSKASFRLDIALSSSPGKAVCILLPFDV